MTKHLQSVYKLLLTVGVIAFICLFIIGAKGRLVVEGQNQGKSLKHSAIPAQPVEVVHISISGRVINLNDNFDDDDDWLKHLSLRIKNKSDKAIVGISMYLDFPETKGTGNIMAFPIWYGQKPATPEACIELPHLMSGEATEVSFSEQQYSKLKSFLESRHSLANIHRADLRVDDVYFADGTVWVGGATYRLDPANPHKLIPVDESQGVRSNQ